MENFEITDNVLPKVDEKAFHCNVSKEMKKKDMNDAYIQMCQTVFQYLCASIHFFFFLCCGFVRESEIKFATIFK